MLTIAWLVSVGLEVESFATDDTTYSFQSAISVALGMPGPVLILGLNNWIVMKRAFGRFEALYILGQILVAFSTLCASFQFDGKMPYVLLVGLPSILCVIFSDGMHPIHKYVVAAVSVSLSS